MKTVTDAEGRTTKYKYDLVGNMTYIEDPAGKCTYYGYHNNDKLWKVSYPDGSIEEFYYNPVGDLDNKHDRKWQTTRFVYDELNRLRYKNYPSGSVEYRYDKLNLKTVIDPNGTTTLNYDKLNRLTSTTSPSGKVVGYEYYKNSLRKKLIYPDNTYITYAYDTLKRLTSIKDSSGSSIATYTYDGTSGRRKGVSYLNGASIEYAYDALNRIKSLKNKAQGGAIFSSFDYTYDKVGNRKTIASKEGTHRYYYDRTYQLIDIIYPDNRTGHYQYDVLGNRDYVDDKGESWDYTLKPNGLNQYEAVYKTKHNIDVKGAVTGASPTVKVNNVPAKISGTSYVAEDVTLNRGANTLTATATNTGGSKQASVNVTLATIPDKVFSYDANGSLTQASYGTTKITYYYDYENRLIKASSLRGSVTTDTIYKYDFLGRRIEKNAAGTVTKYIYDGDNIIAEYNSAGTLTTKYVYGPSIDEPIRMERLASPAAICYYHFDALGSVTDLSNSSGVQVEHYTYSPFGKAKIYDAAGTRRTASAYSNFYMFTARQWDSESNLYYYRARYYDPNLGRFLQADPVGYEADINLYRYCGNNGINLVDPLGLAGYLTIYSMQGNNVASGSFTFGNHSWASYKSDQTQKTTAYGTWGHDIGGKKGLRINTPYERDDNNMTNAVSRTKYINDDQERIMHYVINDYLSKGESAWSKRSACPHFASDLWEQVTGEHLEDRNLFGFGYSDPNVLAQSIIEANKDNPAFWDLLLSEIAKWHNKR